MKPAGNDGGDSETGNAAMRTRALLDSFTRGDQEDVVPMGAMFDGLGKRAFGMVLFIAILPAFLPIPGVGGASGLLVVLLGMQIMVGKMTPWLPGFVARRGPTRITISRFRDRIAPWLVRLERFTRPRAPAVLERWLANVVTGLLLIALGVLLALPIPFTNYLFGVLLLLVALALLERDGHLMVVAWLAGTAAVVFFSLISGPIAAMVGHWIARLF